MNKRILFLSNDQDYLAEKFRINDNHITSVSKIALLKIQSWKFASKTPEIGSQYLSSIEEIIRNSFFCYVEPGHILCEESFFCSPLEN